MMNQQTCDATRLSQFLGGDLNSHDEQLLTGHLDECTSCRSTLDDLAADRESWSEAKELLCDSLDSATSNRPASSHDSLQIEQVLAQLSPTDDPDSFGRIGGYEVTGVVGSGGMGVVLKAHDRSLDRVVAVKVMAPHLAASGSARQRFAREAKAAAAVLHPNVIAIHGVSNDQSLPYLVMPYVRGNSLQKRIDAEGPLPTVDILRIGSQVAAGLAAAHEQGLVHRDIKPANILLEQGVERVAITDFGLARAVDDASMTRSGVIAGTPQYMSPEQARGEVIDARSDLFSLGSLLYAMCTGHSPFRAETSYGVLHRITHDSPRPIRELNPNIPEWLERIVMKLLSKSHDDRFDSAEQVAELLEDCLAHVQHPTKTPLPECVVASSLACGGRPPWGRLIVAAAFGFSIIFAGVLIVLEMNKGTLTIESELDDVPIRIMKGGKLVEQLTVSQAGESTRISAGNYTVEVDQASDEVVVNRGEVSLKRGDTEIVRIILSRTAKEDMNAGNNDSPLRRSVKDAFNIVGDSSEPNSLNPKTTVEAYVKAAIGEDIDSAMTLGLHRNEVPQNIRSWGRHWRRDTPQIERQWISPTNDKAVIVTKSWRPLDDDGRGTMVLAFMLVHVEKVWMIKAIDLWSKGRVEDSANRYLSRDTSRPLLDVSSDQTDSEGPLTPGLKKQGFLPEDAEEVSDTFELPNDEFLAILQRVKTEIDHVAIRKAGREVLATTGPGSWVPVDSAEIPKAIATTYPKFVWIMGGVLRIEYVSKKVYSDTFMSLYVLPEGREVELDPGIKIIDGVWLSAQGGPEFFGTLHAAGATNDNQSATERKLLREVVQGKWNVTRFTDQKRRMVIDRADPVRLNFEKTTMQFDSGVRWDAPIILKWQTRIGRKDSKAPHLNLHLVDFIFDPNGDGKTCKGVMQLDGENLRVCFVAPEAAEDDSPRPEHFVPGSNVVLIECVREQNKGVEVKTKEAKGTVEASLSDASAAGWLADLQGEWDVDMRSMADDGTQDHETLKAFIRGSRVQFWEANETESPMYDFVIGANGPPQQMDLKPVLSDLERLEMLGGDADGWDDDNGTPVPEEWLNPIFTGIVEKLPDGFRYCGGCSPVDPRPIRFAVSGQKSVLWTFKRADAENSEKPSARTDRNEAISIPGSYVAQLPDGRSVELVGITRNNEPVSEGWKPDGRALQEVGDEWHPDVSLGGDSRDFLFRLNGLKNVPSLRFSLPGRGAHYTHMHPDQLPGPWRLRVGGRPEKPRYLRSQFFRQEAGVVQVAITDEAWGDWVQVSATDGSILNPKAHTAEFSSRHYEFKVRGVAALPASPGLTLFQTRRHSQMNDIRIRGIDSEGEESRLTTGHVPEQPKKDWRYPEERTWPLYKPLPDGRSLSHFEFRLRPCRYLVTFENVVTDKPTDKPSEVKVYVETIDDQDAGKVSHSLNRARSPKRGRSGLGPCIQSIVEKDHESSPPETTDGVRLAPASWSFQFVSREVNRVDFSLCQVMTPSNVALGFDLWKSGK